MMAKIADSLFGYAQGGAVDEKEVDRAKRLYRRLLQVFPKQPDNVVPFPTRERERVTQPARTTAKATSLRQGRAPSHPETEDRAQSRGIEGLLRRLFEELATDD